MRATGARARTNTVHHVRLLARRAQHLFQQRFRHHEGLEALVWLLVRLPLPLPRAGTMLGASSCVGLARRSFRASGTLPPTLRSRGWGHHAGLVAGLAAKLCPP